MTTTFLNNNFHQTLLNLGGILSAALIITVPFSTSIPIIISGVLLLIWILSCQFLNLPALLRQNPIAIFALLLFAYFFIGISYSSAPFKEGLHIWAKYRELFLLVVMIPFLSTQRYRNWAISAFVIGSIGTLLVSYAMYFDFVPRPLYAATLKSIITQSIMVSFFAFFCAQQIIKETSYKLKLFWFLLMLLTLHNLYFVAMGRTGQFIGLALLLIFCFQHLNKTTSLLIVFSSVIFFILFINYADMGFRFSEGITNVINYDPNNPETESSMGRRLTFWKNTLKLIHENPWTGHGTGSFTQEYKRIAPSREIMTSNPHNSYLFITAQLGIIGLLIFLGFLGSQYWCFPRLSSQNKCLAQGLLASLVITCLFNAPILDHTEGYWFISLIALFYAPLTDNLDAKTCSV